MLTKFTIISVALFTRFFCVYSQKSSITIGVEQNYGINFWENLDGYKRKNTGNNLGNAASIGFSKGKIFTDLKIIQFHQTYSDVNSNELIAPWHIKSIFHTSKFQGYGLEIGYKCDIDNRFGIAFSFGLNRLIVKKTEKTVNIQDGRQIYTNLDASRLNNRIDLVSSIFGTYGYKKFSFWLGISNVSVVKALNSINTGTPQTLENNTKVSIVPAIKVKYSLWKTK